MHFIHESHLSSTTLTPETCSLFHLLRQLTYLCRASSSQLLLKFQNVLAKLALLFAYKLRIHFWYRLIQSPCIIFRNVLQFQRTEIERFSFSSFLFDINLLLVTTLCPYDLSCAFLEHSLRQIRSFYLTSPCHSQRPHIIH